MRCVPCCSQFFWILDLCSFLFLTFCWYLCQPVHSAVRRFAILAQFYLRSACDKHYALQDSNLFRMWILNTTWLRACSYGQKLSRLPRKHFDKFTSEISPWYEIIWKVALCSYETKVFPGTEISLADRRDLGDRDNFGLIWTQLSR